MLRELHTVLGLLEGGFADLKVLVIGDVMLDRYIHGEVDRISPEAPVPVLRHAQRFERAGGAANVAMNLAGLGCGVVLAGFWGEDTERAELEKILSAGKVDTVGVVTVRQLTTSKTRILGRQQQLLRLDIEDAAPPAEAQRQLLERVVPLVEKVHAVVLSDYAKGAISRELCEGVIRTSRERGIPVLVDPKTPNLGMYSGATMVCPNLQELTSATGLPGEDLPGLMESAEAQRKEHEMTYLTVTMSQRGIRVLSDGGSYLSPARAREVFDVSGAGDTVIAVMAAGLAAGLQVETLADLANVAAGIVVGRVGTVPISAIDLIAALTPSSDVASSEKILSAHQAVQRVAEWRAAGETIVFTNGCFDLLHVGHVTLLEDCKKFGTKLVLGLNADESVRRLKGPARPVVAESARMVVMAALAAVDAVVLFGDDTPLALIEALRPDVLVKGGDYTVETVVGHEAVMAAGGRVQIVPTVSGFSTTSMIAKTQKNGDGSA